MMAAETVAAVTPATARRLALPMWATVAPRGEGVNTPDPHCRSSWRGERGTCDAYTRHVYP
jgi:hypothetical protein